MLRDNADSIREDNEGAFCQRPVRTDLETPPKHNHHVLPADACYDVYSGDSLLEAAYQATIDGDDSAIREWSDRRLSAQRIEDFRALVELLLTNPRKDLAIECLGFAVGSFATEDTKETDIAKRYGISRAAVCKRVMEYRDMLHTRSRIMKSDEARRNYRTNKLGKGHWRSQDDRLEKRYKLKLGNMEKMHATNGHRTSY